MNKQETFAKLRLTIPPDMPMLDAALYKIMELEQQLATLRELREIDSKKLAEAQKERDLWRGVCECGINANNLLIKQIVMLRDYLEQLACLGNGNRHGNSVGNDIAIKALAATSELSGYILCDAEPFGYVLEGEDMFLIAADLGGAMPHEDWTKLYKARTK